MEEAGMPNTLVALSFHAGAQAVMRPLQQLAVASTSMDEGKWIHKCVSKAAQELEN
jgi:hypothetical protein